jgi:hypothetical protein
MSDEFTFLGGGSGGGGGGGDTPDADAVTKGKLRLAGDLAGTAASPAIAAGAVTSAKIADGTIVNADISGSAAIAPAKVAGTAVVDADARLTDARTPTAHASTHAPAGSDPATGLTAASMAAGSVDGAAGTASLRTLGTGAAQAAAGNDSRIAGAAQKASNLSDLANAGTARTNLGLGGAAVLAVGTGAGTVAAGDDSRITGAAQKSANLSDLANAATSRTNLGVPATTRSIATTAPLAGGGDLSADRTLTVANATTGAVGVVQLAGDLTGIATAPVVAAARYAFTPPDHGLKAWTFEPVGALGGAIPVSGTLQLARVHLPVAATITNIVLNIITAGSTLTSGQCFAGLWTAAGAKVDVTADQAASWVSTGNKTMALAAGPYSAAAGDYYIGWWSNGTTNPAFARQGTTVLVNVGLAAPNYRFCTADTGLTNAASAPANLAAQAQALFSFWAALS